MRCRPQSLSTKCKPECDRISIVSSARASFTPRMYSRCSRKSSPISLDMHVSFRSFGVGMRDQSTDLLKALACLGESADRCVPRAVKTLVEDPQPNEHVRKCRRVL